MQPASRDAGVSSPRHGEWAFEHQRGIHMNEISNWSDAEARKDAATTKSRLWPWILGLAVIAIAAAVWYGVSYRDGGRQSLPRHRCRLRP